MHPMGDIREHFWLTLGMARRCGVDFAELLHTGQITQAQYAEFITRCRGCDRPDHCHSVLQDAERPTPPDYCCNRDEFSRLTGKV